MDSIICPHCNKKIVLEEAIIHALSARVRNEEQEKAKAQMEKTIALERTQSEKKLREEFERENKDKDKELENAVKKEKELEEKLLKASQEKIKIEERVREETFKEVSGKARLEKLEYEKKIADMQKALEEAQRKGKQGSQQLQGEVLELDLEEKLKQAFPYDRFEPVAKGKEGGDILHFVNNKFGKTGSVIIWEFKRTKAWNKNWLTKLREDKRVANANEAIIVAEVLPEEVGVYEKIDGVWITSRPYALPLAKILREMGLRVAAAKSGAQHDDQSLKKLHDYILSEKFRHKIEREVETVNRATKNLEDKHRADEKYYRLQRANLEALSDNTSQIYFDLQDVLPSLPSVAGLESTLLDEDEETEQTLL